MALEHNVFYWNCADNKEHTHKRIEWAIENGYLICINITINDKLIIDFDLISIHIDNNIYDNFYCFDPDIKFNEYGNEIIPIHHDIFYGYYSVVRNFRKYDSIKPVSITFSNYNNIIEPNKYIKDIIEKMKIITFEK